jgi:hypothetical protein
MYWSCCTSFPPKLKERYWKIRSTKVDAGNLKHELLNRLWSNLAVNMLKNHNIILCLTVSRLQNNLRLHSCPMCRYLSCNGAATLKCFSLTGLYLSAGRMKMLNSLDYLKQSTAYDEIKPTKCIFEVKERLHGSLWLINVIESTKVNRVNSTFQRKWSARLKQVGDGQLSFNVDDSLW